MSDIMKFILVLAIPLIALIELTIISFVISILDGIFDDIGMLMDTISKWFGGGKE